LAYLASVITAARAGFTLPALPQHGMFKIVNYVYAKDKYGIE